MRDSTLEKINSTQPTKKDTHKMNYKAKSERTDENERLLSEPFKKSKPTYNVVQYKIGGTIVSANSYEEACELIRQGFSNGKQAPPKQGKPAKPSGEHKFVPDAHSPSLNCEVCGEPREEHWRKAKPSGEYSPLLHESGDHCPACFNAGYDSGKISARADADKLAEALRDLLTDSRSLEIRHYAKAQLRAWEGVQS